MNDYKSKCKSFTSIIDNNNIINNNELTTGDTFNNHLHELDIN